MRVDGAVSSPRVPLVVIPCLNEAPHIRRLGRQMARAVAPYGGCVVIADGGSTDGTLALAEELAEAHSEIVVLRNEARLQSSALNAAVAQYGDGHTDVIRIDAHCAYPDDYIAVLLDEAARTGAASVVVGMVASGDGLLQRINAATQNSRLGNGGSKHRARGSGEFVEHGHHALMRLDAFRAVGGYDPTFSHNEDAELDYRLGRAGYRIWLTKRTEITYFPRRDVAAIARQYFNYGRGRARNLLKHRTLPNPRQAVMVAVAPVVAAAALAPIHAIFATPLVLWAFAANAAGLRLALAERSGVFLLAGPIAMIMHLSWSLGFWRMLAAGLPRARKAVPA